MAPAETRRAGVWREYVHVGKVHARRGAALCKQIAGKKYLSLASFRSVLRYPRGIAGPTEGSLHRSYLIETQHPRPDGARLYINLDSTRRLFFAIGRQQRATLCEEQKGERKTMKETG